MNEILTVEVDGKFHSINFPNVGQILKIRSLSLALSSNHYTQFVDSDMKIDNWTLLAIDTIATFSVLLPEIQKQLSKDFLQMSPIEMNKFIKVYKGFYIPWYEYWNKEFVSTMDEILKGSEINDIKDL
jgi:hypothetical protein